MPTDASGAFVRPSSAFREHVVGEPGRYHLFVATGCPWASRTIIYRNLKQLTSVVSMSDSPEQGAEGWYFTDGIDELQPVDGKLWLHRVYTAAKSDCTGRVTVPVLWDRQRKTIVNNESSEIIRMFDSDFGSPGPRYYVPELAAEIDALNARIYETLNNGVYRAGFARTQEAYEVAARGVFATLDELEARLAKSRYLLGDRITEADLRLLPTLLRFDVAYYTVFKCNLRRLEDYPNLSGYARDLAQVEGIRETVQPEVYRTSYHAIRQVNPHGIVPIGPLVDFTRPHDRASRTY